MIRLSVNKKGSPYYRQVRHKHLKSMVDVLGDAKKHSGGGNAPDWIFQEAFNNQKLVGKVGRVRSQDDVFMESETEVKQAQDLLLMACKNCEFFPCELEPGEDFSLQHVKEIFRGRRRKIFWKIHANEDGITLKRVRDRLGQKDVASGAKSASCAVLIRKGRIDKLWTR